MSKPPILPMELMEKCIGQNIQVIMKTNKEFIGTLSGYDTFFRKTYLITR
jgi:U6 snRNA-associated Sm-like protein LSm5